MKSCSWCGCELFKMCCTRWSRFLWTHACSFPALPLSQLPEQVGVPGQVASRSTGECPSAWRAWGLPGGVHRGAQGPFPSHVGGWVTYLGPGHPWVPPPRVPAFPVGVSTVSSPLVHTCPPGLAGRVASLSLITRRALPSVRLCCCLRAAPRSEGFTGDVKEAFGIQKITCCLNKLWLQISLWGDGMLSLRCCPQSMPESTHAANLLCGKTNETLK